VVVALEQTCAVTGYPTAIRVDQGSEFISRQLDLWAYEHDVTLDFSLPGSRPTMRSSRRSTGASGRSA
jgi:putative transposase